MNRTPDGYLHAEAFCLMTYHCRVCGFIERLWNSRDGVTPFIIGCQQCGGEAQHINWSQDIRAPQHQPKPGDRVFVDLTPERARMYANRRFDQAKGTRYELPESEREQFVEGFMRSLQPGEPDSIIVGDEGWRPR